MKVKVSTRGGVQPVWSRGGRTLYFRDKTDILSVPVTATGASLQAGVATRVVSDRWLRSRGANHTTYDVFADGSVLLLQLVGNSQPPEVHVHGVFNWFDELKKKLP
jgi:hypothetical protein